MSPRLNTTERRPPKGILRVPPLPPPYSYTSSLDTTIYDILYPLPSYYPSLIFRHDCRKFFKCCTCARILNVFIISQIASPLRMDALLHVTRQLSKLDPNRLLTNIQHVATGDSRAPSAWMSLFYDLKELEDVFHKLSQAGHDVRDAHRDFNDLRRWVYAAASTMSPPTPHSSRSTQLVPPPRSPHNFPSQPPSQRSPVTTSTRPEHMPSRVSSSVPLSPRQPHRSSGGQARVSSSAPPSPQQPHRSTRGQLIAPTPVRAPPSPKARAHVRFAPTATVYTISRYAHATPPPAERPSGVPRSPRQSHAK
jgi:hypothetical protein